MSAAGGRINLLFFLLLPILTGCGAFCRPAPTLQSGPARLLIADVPFYAQEEHQCGPAAMAMLLAWSGLPVTPADLRPQVFSPVVQGSLQPALIAAARRHGRLAYPITGRAALFAELAAGHPVLVLQNLGLAWLPRWHYAVAVGYDLAAGRILLHTGTRQGEPLSFRVFENTWARSAYWGLVILPPDRLPATAEEKTFLAAAIGLEQSREWPAAVTAYRTALNRWPASFAAWMGLGNSRYALGDPAGAEQAFRRATALQPDNGAALNNLAQALAVQGRKAEALAAAQQAVRCGGAWQEYFQQTLAEIGAGD